MKNLSFTSEEVTGATYNELRKFAKESELHLGRGVTAETYRAELLKLFVVAEPKKPAVVKTAVDTVSLNDLKEGDSYKFPTSDKVYQVLEKAENFVKVKIDRAWRNTWREFKLDKQVVKITQEAVQL